MKDSTKEIQKQLWEGRKFGTKPVVVDELNDTVPSSKEKEDHLRRIRQDYVINLQQNS